MNRRGVLLAVIALALLGGGCLATRPYVRSEVQKSEGRTQEQLQQVQQVQQQQAQQQLQQHQQQTQQLQQLQTIDRRVDVIERDLSEERAQRTRLEGDLSHVRRAVEDVSRQVEQTRELAAKAERSARDAQTVSRAPVSKTPESSLEPEILVVHFGAGDWLLDTSARSTLERALKRLRENPAARVKLEGHADSLGSATENLKLSQRRADEVWRFLVANGVKRKRIEALPIGEAQPVAPNTSPKGRDQNRRVAITILRAE